MNMWPTGRQSAKYAVARSNEATAKQISREIDRQLRHDRRRRQLERRILLLGTASSGKSTFMRSMRIISSDEFEQQEIMSFKSVIYSNVWRGVMKLLFVRQKLEIKWQNSKAAVTAVKSLLQLDQQLQQQLQQNRLHSISEQQFQQAVPIFKTFWSDSAFRQAFANRHLVQGDEEFKDIGENLDFFLDQLDALAAANYRPTHAHLLRSRRFTDCVFERSLEFKGVPLRIIDIGGHTNERRKWVKVLRVFHGELQSVIYIIAASTFNETYVKASTNEVVNKLDEGYDCLSHLLQMKHELFTDSMSLIVFFNKEDLLLEKVQTLASDFAEFDATFDKNSYDARNILHVRNHLVCRLQRTLAHSLQSLPLYTHFTCSIDIRNVSRVFEDIRHAVMNHFIAEAMPS